MDKTGPDVNIQQVMTTQNAWRTLSVINLFRILIAGLFVILYSSDKLFAPLASHNPHLFISVSIFHLIGAVLISILLYRRSISINPLAYLNVYLDVIAITLLMHASGGVTSGLGTLMVITIGGGSIVMGGRHALLFASLCTIAVLLEQIFTQFENPMRNQNELQAGILGITFFVTAILTHTFARRILESEELAKKRGVDLANMAQLTEHIIQRMQTGIIVVDSHDRLVLINESAWYMLGMPSKPHATALVTLNRDIAQQLAEWKKSPDWTSRPVKPSAEHGEIIPRFARISGEDKNSGTLIFLEDSTAVARQAQQLQLASLGRLTASIAHEIRNPLGAISHAGQLLEESPNIDENDQRLTRIIADHSRRVNTIVENIMQLGRRDRSHPEVLNLKDFTKKFLSDFLTGTGDSPETISLSVTPDDVSIRFDATHLQQILTNLCENALRYSQDYPGLPKVEIAGGVTEDLNRPYLDIVDHGPGIDEESLAHIFEPFFTTSSSGTGLGLYISRELAECNQAHISYSTNDSGGSCFRITFQDPRRQMS